MMLCAFKCCCLLVLFTLPQLICGLKNVNLQVRPGMVQRGDSVTLMCTYDLEDDNLYSIRYYKGVDEFFRYTPADSPKFMLFTFMNIDVDLKQSDEHRVFIKSADFNLSANFLCEVTTEGPTFLSITARQKLLVVELPDAAPEITTEKTAYTTGYTLKANCTSGPSRPAVKLVLSINNMVVCKQCETVEHPSGDLFVSKAALKMPLLQQHFSDGQLKIRCSAQIAGVYQRDTDLIFSEDEENVYEKVTSSAPVPQRQHSKIFNTALMILRLFSTWPNIGF